jgi:hypothetical protein
VCYYQVGSHGLAGPQEKRRTMLGQVIRELPQGATDRDWARQIAADGIQALIYLDGREDQGRTGIYARRPAPVQVMIQTDERKGEGRFRHCEYEVMIAEETGEGQTVTKHTWAPAVHFPSSFTLLHSRPTPTERLGGDRRRADRNQAHLGAGSPLPELLHTITLTTHTDRTARSETPATRNKVCVPGRREHAP